MQVSIIVAAHNEGDALLKTVQSCVETCGRLDCEVIIADDASHDDSISQIEQCFPRMRIVRNTERLGASPTKDRGARAASGDILVFLDGHTKPERGALQRMVDDIHLTKGKALITPTIVSLDVSSWRSGTETTGHGYRIDLESLDTSWLPVSDLQAVSVGARTLFETPAAIGCAFAVTRDVYEMLWGFDPDMRFWGIEDLDFSIKCWLMGIPILHDPEPVVGHRFQRAFVNYSVPNEHLVANQLRLARKNFTHKVWEAWVEQSRRRFPGGLTDHPEGLWTAAWQTFESRRASAEEERSYLMARRTKDEIWYADRFGLKWPQLGATRERRLLEQADKPSPSPSPPPKKCKVEKVTPANALVCVGGSKTFVAHGKNLKDLTWTVDGMEQSATGTTLTVTFDDAGDHTVTASCESTSASTTITAVSVTFSPGSGVITGMTGTLPANPCNIQNIEISTPATATVRPISAVSKVTLKLTGVPRAEITSTVVDTESGTITVRMKGLSMTPKNKKDGDCFLQAVLTGVKDPCAKIPVVVVVPYRLKPVSSGPEVVTGDNQIGDPCSSPAYIGDLGPGEVHLWTTYGIRQDIPVLDQFGDELSDIYNGAPVFEFDNAGGTWRPINVFVSGGSYDDPVGATVNRGLPIYPDDQSNWPATSTTATNWPDAVLMRAPLNFSETQNINVQIAGISLDRGVKNRKVSVKRRGAATANVTITWN